MELKELQATKLACQKQIGLLEKRIRLIDVLIKEKLRDEEKEKERESEKKIEEIKEEEEEEREKEVVRHAGGGKGNVAVNK
jgi:hypothetical protein